MHIEPLHPIQLARFRAMSPMEKWEISKAMLKTATDIRRAVLRKEHPDWTAYQVERQIAWERASGRT